MAEKTMMSYQELVENSSKYNSNLLAARRARIPYHDPSTGVNYSDGRRIYVEKERAPGLETGQVYTYPSRRWKLRPRPPPIEYFMAPQPISMTDPNQSAMPFYAASSSAPVVMPVPMEQSSTSSFVAKVYEDSYGSSRDIWVPPEPQEMHLAEEGEMNDPETEDDDFEEGFGRKRKKPASKAGRARKNVDYTVLTGTLKPFSCNYCDMCYKTRPGLTYHVTKEHPNGQRKDGHSQPQPAVFQPPAADRGMVLQRDKEGRSLVCDFCECENATVKPAPRGEKLHSCTSCGHSAHPTCLNFTKNQRESTRQYPWKCIECKSCSMCNSAGNDDKLLFCDDCDRGYHMYCLRPPLDATPEGLWSCDPCLVQYGEEAAFQVWKRKVQQETVARYKQDLEEQTRRNAYANNNRPRYSVSVQMEQQH